MKNKCHDLKIESKYFDFHLAGKKNWEVRNNDRNFLVGDDIFLHEIKDGKLTGRVLLVNINYVFKSDVFLKDNIVILSTSQHYL